MAFKFEFNGKLMVVDDELLNKVRQDAYEEYLIEYDNTSLYIDIMFSTNIIGYNVFNDEDILNIQNMLVPEFKSHITEF